MNRCRADRIQGQRKRKGILTVNAIKLRKISWNPNLQILIISLKYQTLPNLKVWTPRLNLMALILTVPCQLNDKYHRNFLVDSGAAFTVISQQLAREMKLDIIPPVRQIRIASAHQVAQTPVVRLDSLQVDDKKSQPFGGINC